MINTNGVRIAQDREFVARLASYAPRLEVYLQFDSLDDAALLNLRGAKLKGKQGWWMTLKKKFQQERNRG